MSFKLPIYYCKNKSHIFKNLYSDLELLEGVNNGMYKYLLNPKTTLGENILSQWSKYYTTDIEFLKESQKLYGSLENEEVDIGCTEDMKNIWGEIKNQKNFLEKYQYVDWEKIKWINEYSPFMSFMSFYNLASPALNLLLPIIILLIPFFLLKIMGVPCTFAAYKKILLEQIRNHSIGQLFTEFNNVGWDKRIYLVVSFGIYLFNIYQNMVSCYRFYYNMKNIERYFTIIRTYIRYTIEKINIVLKNIKSLKTYSQFSTHITLYKNKFLNFESHFPRCRVFSGAGLMKLGDIMKHFYLIYEKVNLNDMFTFSFGFNGFWDTIVGLSNNKNVNNATFKKKSLKFEKAYYPPLVDGTPVKNNISLKKNIIISGPNAAGKTTLLKCVILNLLFTQQVGKGFYDKAILMPFDYIHCYLNIPDTSGRDSLFQAEARRCKKILSFIENIPKKRHFCIFDELYSGTNHYEAIGTAYSYLTYISENKNVRFMLTTHFIQLCSLFDKERNISNMKMETNIVKNSPHYSYKMIKGVSKIKGGICVLRQLQYPHKILNLTKKTIRAL